MTWVEPAGNDGMAEPGDVRLADGAQKIELIATAATQGYLCVEIGAPGPALRGRLALLVEGAIEDALQRRGAAPPGVGASSDLDASLSDQLYRARQVGARGLFLAFGSLEGIANLAGALDAEDSAVLRWWFVSVTERPVRIVLAARDRYLGIYAAPTTLSALLGGSTGASPRPEAGRGSAEDIPSPVPELVASSRAMDLSSVSASEHFETDRPGPNHDASEIADGDDHTPEQSAAELWEPDELLKPADPAHFMARAKPDPSFDEPDLAQNAIKASDSAQGVKTSAGAIQTPQATRTDWRIWLREIDAARGPKPLATIERMFVSAYVPLCEAVARGVADERAHQALVAWSTSFEHSYREAFDALRLRGKRPLMVLDLPDAAFRIGRLHGARSVQLLLVDGMRFDLGLRIQERMHSLLDQRAALTERLLMWSALPSTTAVQLELIARGADGLRDLGAAAPLHSDIPVARGRNALTVRRVKAGAREIMKLDVIEARISEPGGPLLERFDSIATEAAEALANHFLRLPARTLVMVFGDHGFALDAKEPATAQQGGASPEQVLVPAFAWLTGDVH